MRNKILWILIIFSLACDPVPPFNDIPYFPFDDIEINTNLPDYSPLRIDGGIVPIDGGVRGIFIYRENSTTFHAIERNCSYTPNEACATVDIDASKLFLFDPCCNSNFTLPYGIPNGGPAFYPLRKYQVIQNGSVLTITDLVVN